MILTRDLYQICLTITSLRLCLVPFTDLGLLQSPSTDMSSTQLTVLHYTTLPILRSPPSYLFHFQCPVSKISVKPDLRWSLHVKGPHALHLMAGGPCLSYRKVVLGAVEGNSSLAEERINDPRSVLITRICYLT